jgi:hypothetical protein
MIQNGKAFWVPFQNTIEQIISEAHNEGGAHLGRGKLINKIKNMGFNMIGLWRVVEKCIDNCIVCMQQPRKKVKSQQKIQRCYKTVKSKP